MDSADIEALLEEGERAANTRAQQNQHEPDFIPLDGRISGQHTPEHHNERSRRQERGRRNNNRYSAEREENDERRSRRSKDLAGAEDVKDSSDQGSANGSSGSRRGGRSRSPHRNRRSSRDRHSYRERDRMDRGGDYYRGGGRGRDDDDRYRPGDRRYDSRRDGRSRNHSQDRGRAKTPEPTDDERDRRTVFVQQLAARLRSRELKEFFEQVGEVVDAQIVKDRISGRSKGVGYVEFKVEESVEKAIALTGQKLLNIPLIVSHTEAEKNRQVRNTEGAATQSNGVPFHRLYVGNIHFSITEQDIKDVFEPFGELEFVQLQKEEGTGKSKGYGFVQFVDPDRAKEALEKMNSFVLAGRPIRVGLGNDKFTTESTKALAQRWSTQDQQNSFQGSQFSGAGGRGSHAGGSGNFDRASGRDVDKTNGASALDDTDVAGVNFNNYSRDSLMRKLLRNPEPEPAAAPQIQAQKRAPIENVAPSRCVLLKHMFVLADENEPNWQETIKEDVRQECEEKYGHVVHIGLALNNDDGEIYVKFDRVQGGENAIRGLNGRFFDHRMISAQYVVDAFYNSNFPKAKDV